VEVEETAGPVSTASETGLPLAIPQYARDIHLTLPMLMLPYPLLMANTQFSLPL